MVSKYYKKKFPTITKYIELIKPHEGADFVEEFVSFENLKSCCIDKKELKELYNSYEHEIERLPQDQSFDDLMEELKEIQKNE